MFGVEKLRPDWTVKTYVIPVSRIEASDEFWAEARTLKNAWNEIVTAYRAFDEQIPPLETELARLRKEKLIDGDVKTALSKARAERKKKTLATWKAQSPKVLYNDLENLRIAAESAINLAYKNSGTLHFKKGIEAVNFSKRFKSGGVAFAELFTELDSRDDKLRRKPLAVRIGEKRASNRSRSKTPLHIHFLAGKSRVPVKLTGVWSYPVFPEAGFVKKVTLVGKTASRLRIWRWRLHLIIEEPPARLFPNSTLPIAALDLGYRRFADFIRFGFVVDSMGNKIELRLPDGNMNSAYLKRTIKFLAKKGAEKQYIKDLKDYFGWDSAQGASLEAAKAELKTLLDSAKTQQPEMPEAWREIFTGFVKARNRALRKLKKVSAELLNGENAITETAKDLLNQTIEIVDRWQEKDIYFEIEKEHFRRKFTGRRKLVYRQTAKWLASNYSQLVWKEDLRLREMATEAKKSSRVTNAALKESNKYRQWASLHEFRLFIKEQSAKNPDWSHAVASTDRSPPVCDECGASIISDSSELMLVCANGHKKDRDERAAAKLLQQAALGFPSNAVAVNIPPNLKDYIVRIA